MDGHRHASLVAPPGSTRHEEEHGEVEKKRKKIAILPAAELGRGAAVCGHGGEGRAGWEKKRDGARLHVVGLGKREEREGAERLTVGLLHANRPRAQPSVMGLDWVRRR